jgi:FkbM family methyltransferase
MSDFRRRAAWVVHVVKAATQQHHLPLEGVFRPHIPLDAVVFDIGAHAGQFSKLFARMSPRGQVFAFEPSAYARSVMANAIGWNRLSNIEIVPLGLSDAEGTAALVTPVKRSGALGFGLAHLGVPPTDGHAVGQTTSLTTLDGFVRSRALARLDFIKADVEGWEAHSCAARRTPWPCTAQPCSWKSTAHIWPGPDRPPRKYGPS